MSDLPPTHIPNEPAADRRPHEPIPYPSGALPPAPRPVTAQVHKSLRNEPRVRSWWLWSIAMTLLFLAIFIFRLTHWSADRALIDSGELVNATVTRADSIDMVNKKMAPTSRVDLRYDYNNAEYSGSGFLQDRKDFIVVGETVPIRIDRKNPSSWTGRTTVDPLISRVVDVLFLPLPALLLLLAAKFEKNRLMKVWINGPVIDATVSQIQRSPMAPSSQLLTVAPRGTKSKQLLRVYVPGSAIRKGDTVRILTDEHGHRGLAAAAVKV